MIAGKDFFASWSGGKDACLSLHYARENGGRPKGLLTMFNEDGGRSRGHGLPPGIIRAQAEALGLPLFTRNASWDDYESRFLSALREFKAAGLACGVFGDIDLAGHLAWVERVCAAAGIGVYEPLWQRKRRELLEAFFSLGFEALIISVRADVLDPDFLGRPLDWDTVRDLERAGVDASGEGGEYHTVVTGGPLFSAPVPVVSRGQVVRENYVLLDLELAATPR